MLCNGPSVSVIIPTYSRASLLSRAIDSVLDQNYQNFEIIVVDDNEPSSQFRTETEMIMKKYLNNQKVHYIKHNKNMNGSVARNTGIHHSSGELICFLDDDNYFYDNKLQRQVEFLKNNKQFKAVYCGMNVDGINKSSYATGDLTYEQLTGEAIIDTNTIMIEKNIIEKFSGWDERLSRNQDVSFAIRYFLTGNIIGVIEDPLIYYDSADRSMFPSPEKNERNTAQFLELYSEAIDYCEQQKKHAKKTIYAYRYRGVFFSYLKKYDIKNAIRIYFFMLKKAPIIFNRLIFKRFLNQY